MTDHPVFTPVRAIPCSHVTCPRVKQVCPHLRRQAARPPAPRGCLRRARAAPTFRRTRPICPIALLPILPVLTRGGGGRFGQVRAILVSERSEETPGCGMMEERGVAVERLIEQSLGKVCNLPIISPSSPHLHLPISPPSLAYTHLHLAISPPSLGLHVHPPPPPPPPSPPTLPLTTRTSARPSSYLMGRARCPSCGPRERRMTRSSPSRMCPSRSISSSAGAPRGRGAARPSGTREGRGKMEVLERRARSRAPCACFGLKSTTGNRDGAVVVWLRRGVVGDVTSDERTRPDRVSLSSHVAAARGTFRT